LLWRPLAQTLDPHMRVFHFVNEEFGLEDLRRRRLKIATLNELNDPFELFGVNLADESLRRAFRAMKDQLALNRGLLSFSRDWHNLFSGATTLQSILAYASASIFQTKILARSPIRENASRWKSRAFVTPANSVSISSNGSC
jgi:hypothetical protein